MNCELSVMSDERVGWLTTRNSKLTTPSPGSAILSLTAALLTVGIVMVFSTATQIESPRNAPPWWATAAVRQTAFSLTALLVMLAVSRIDYSLWYGRTDSSPRLSAWLLVITFILLAAVLVPGIGIERNGARRW